MCTSLAFNASRVRGYPLTNTGAKASPHLPARFTKTRATTIAVMGAFPKPFFELLKGTVSYEVEQGEDATAAARRVRGAIVSRPRINARGVDARCARAARSE